MKNALYIVMAGILIFVAYLIYPKPCDSFGPWGNQCECFGAERVLETKPFVEGGTQWGERSVCFGIITDAYNLE